MDLLIEAIIRECALRMGIMIGDVELPPGLAENLECRIRQFIFESTGGNHRDWQRLAEDPNSSIGHLMAKSIEGSSQCHKWRPQVASLPRS